MKIRAAFLALPVIAFAQTPPAEVDQALRARVSEFFQSHVDGTFRKAYELVAEDTKEYYFGSQKNKLQSFKIDTITYSDSFADATVQLTCQRIWRPSAQFPEVSVTVPMITNWKIEDGKWVYYHDPKLDRLTPYGSSNAPRVATPNGAVPPPDLSEAAIAEAARKIMRQSSVDKAQVTLATDKPSSEQVVFHNGFQGWVQVVLDPGPKTPGFSAELDKTSVNAGEDAVLKLRYQPADDQPAPVIVRLTIEPFNQTFPISVSFAAK